MLVLVKDYATLIHETLESGQLETPVVFTDFEPTTRDGFTPTFAKKFNCPEGTEDVVRDALDYLHEMGAIRLDRDPVRAATNDRKQYPAEYCVTVQLH